MKTRTQLLLLYLLLLIGIGILAVRLYFVLSICGTDISCLLIMGF